MTRTKKRKPGRERREAEAMQRKQQVEMAALQNSASEKSCEQLYASAIQYMEQSQPQDALEQATQLWSQVATRSVAEALPAANLLGSIYIEMGEVEAAVNYYEKAVQLDPEGTVPETQGGGAEKFLWLAQLCEQGGKESVLWYEKGVKALQLEIAALEGSQMKDFDDEDVLIMRIEKKRKLANALCGIVEVYMTDLSWEDDAEIRCETLITEAMSVEDDTSPGVLQTLASVRLSQQRKEDAQSALRRSLESWMNLEPEDPHVPDFASRISLSRLLMEAEMEHEAMEVLHRLVAEDDQSIEAWYLGGWCQYLIAENHKATTDSVGDSIMVAAADASGDPSSANNQVQKTLAAFVGSRRWLRMSLRLFQQLEYEDDRLFQHATELVSGLDTVLGPDDGDAEDEEEDWDGIEDEAENLHEDEEMS